MKHSKEIAELLERIEALEAQLAPKPKPKALATTAQAMREMFGMETGADGKIIATPEEIAAYEAREKEKSDAADRAIARAKKWERENGTGYSGYSSNPAEVQAVLEGQRAEQRAITAENSYRRDADQRG